MSKKILSHVPATYVLGSSDPGGTPPHQILASSMEVYGAYFGMQMQILFGDGLRLNTFGSSMYLCIFIDFFFSGLSNLKFLMVPILFG